MNQIIDNRRNKAGADRRKNVSGLRSWLLIALLLVTMAGCSSEGDEQATIERMTVIAADEMAAATHQAEEEEATKEAKAIALVTSEAATAEAKEALSSQATSEAEEAANTEATAEAMEAEIAEATANAQATAEAEAQATAEAEAQATANAEATRIAFESAQKDLVDEAQDEMPIVTLDEGSLVHDEDDEPEREAAHIDLRNIVIETRFNFRAGDTDLDKGDFGIEFRADDQQATRLLITQDGHWELINENEDDLETLQEGELGDVKDGWNKVVLYVDEEEGFFLFNGDYVDELDLTETAETGDIHLVCGLLPNAEVLGASTDYEDFSVWSLDPVPATPTPPPQTSDSQTSDSQASEPQPPPPSSSAHTFPETPIRPFNRDEFISYVGQMRDSFRSFTSEMTLMLETGKYGDCGSFNGWLGLWVRQSPGYTDVPPSYAGLYGEYRSMLREVVAITEEIRVVCSAEGGDVSDETIINIITFLSWAYPRSEMMVSEASSLPPL